METLQDLLNAAEVLEQQNDFYNAAQFLLRINTTHQPVVAELTKHWLHAVELAHQLSQDQ